MPTTFRCLNRRCPVDDFTLPFELGTVTVGGGSGGNFVVQCPRCRKPSEQAPVDGHYDASSGRLELIRVLADYLQEFPPETPSDLADRIEKADPALRPLAAWVRDHQDALIGVLVAVVLFVLGQMMTRPGITTDDLERIIEHAQKQAEQQSESGSASDSGDHREEPGLAPRERGSQHEN